MSLTPFQSAIKLLYDDNSVAARVALSQIWIKGGSNAADAARYIARIDSSEYRYGDAIAILEASLEKFGDDALTLASLSELYMNTGLYDSAISAAKRSLKRKPDNAITALNLTIWQSNYEVCPARIRSAFEQWSAKFVEPLSSGPCAPAAGQLADVNGRPLRVGYISGDLCNHAVRYLIEPYLARHDTFRFEIHAFMTSEEDEISYLLRQSVPHWHNVKALDNAALLGLIRELKIDILVDLSGHTEGSRLEVFAARAAPVQVTWWGFVHTLGMAEIDYRLTDYEICPEGTEANYTEALCRMKCLTAYAPPVNSDTQYPSPWKSNNYVTMVSLNHTRKISNIALDSWRSILEKNPNSGLIIVTNEPTEAAVADSFIPRLKDHRLPLDRVSAVPRMSMAGFMNIASVADFALDSFPVSGGVTTLHSLWMGLPVLTFKPENAIAIQTYSGNILREVGLDECVTSSPQELVSRASCWMQNPNLIDNLRSKTREKLVSSPFMDYDHRVRELEACFSEMWRRFMENEAVEDLTIADYES